MCPCPPPKNGSNCSCDDLYMLTIDSSEVISYSSLNNRVQISETRDANNKISKLTFAPNLNVQNTIQNQLYTDYVKIKIVGRTKELILPFHLKRISQDFSIIGPQMR